MLQNTFEFQFRYTLALTHSNLKFSCIVWNTCNFKQEADTFVTAVRSHWISRLCFGHTSTVLIALFDVTPSWIKILEKIQTTLTYFNLYVGGTVAPKWIDTILTVLYRNVILCVWNLFYSVTTVGSMDVPYIHHLFQYILAH
jgi:hypothetical protein